MQNERILASVMGNPITDSDVDRMIQSLGQRGQGYNSPQGRAVILDQLISQRLMLLDAQRSFLEHDPVFQQQLKQVKDELLVNFAIGKLISGISVSDAEARAFYDAHPDQFVGEESVHASHILVDSEEKAAELRGKIESGELTFEAAAEKHSTCPSSVKGGDLGEFSQGQMVPEFDKACFALEPGVLSAPVQTKFGWHLIRVSEKHPAEAMKFDEIKDELKQQLMVEKQQKAYASRINQLKIQYPVDKY